VPPFNLQEFIMAPEDVSIKLLKPSIVPLLGNDGETSNYTTDITMQRPVQRNRGTVFSVWSVPRCYKQDKLAVAVS
jgi:hypothetical protein